jgi:hypothetical protein
MDFSPDAEVRLLMKEDMVELVNVYLINLKRVPSSGQIGFLGAAFQDISVWQSKHFNP